MTDDAATDPDLDRLRYPVGRFQPQATLTAAERQDRIDEIRRLPGALREAVHDLTDDQLDTRYRPEGWTLRQVVHHVPDSHLNGYVRFKKGVTEDEPPITTYQEAEWAELEDARTAPVEPSLSLLERLHFRWVRFLESLPAEAWSRSVLHPESGSVTLDRLLQLYAWHGRHHVAHVTELRSRRGWDA